MGTSTSPMAKAISGSRRSIAPQSMRCDQFATRERPNCCGTNPRYDPGFARGGGPGRAGFRQEPRDGAERTTLSEESGGFTITSVPAGSYEVSVSLPGFQKEVRSGVTLTVGGTLRLDFMLKVGVVQERVVVTGEAPQVDTTTSTMAGLAGLHRRSIPN